MSYILTHLPHCSKEIPVKYRDQFLLSDSELAEELLKITDHYVDELFEYPGQTIQYNSVSRLVMDPERYEDDNREEMSKKGMGLAYIKTSGGKELRKLTGPEREEIVKSLYDPYHEAFTGKVADILGRYNMCLIIDAHSFPSKPLSYEDKGETRSVRTDICLGYGNDHYSYDLLKTVDDYFCLQCGLSVAHNDPFAGSIVPRPFDEDDRVQSIMIEINRSLYMNELTGQKSTGFKNVHEMIRGLFDQLQRFVALDH